MSLRSVLYVLGAVVSCGAHPDGMHRETDGDCPSVSAAVLPAGEQPDQDRIAMARVGYVLDVLARRADSVWVGPSSRGAVVDLYDQAGQDLSEALGPEKVALALAQFIAPGSDLLPWEEYRTVFLAGRVLSGLPDGMQTIDSSLGVLAQGLGRGSSLTRTAVWKARVLLPPDVLWRSKGAEKRLVGAAALLCVLPRVTIGGTPEEGPELAWLRMELAAMLVVLLETTDAAWPSWDTDLPLSDDGFTLGQLQWIRRRAAEFRRRFEEEPEPRLWDWPQLN
jgi:hypothetical protein